MRVRIEWTDEDRAHAESILGTWSDVQMGARIWEEADMAARALLQLQIAADELVQLALLRRDLTSGTITAEQLAAMATNAEELLGLTSSNAVGSMQQTADELDAQGVTGLGDLYAMARGSVLDVYRAERARDGYVLHLTPLPWETGAELGAGWVIPLIVVGGAALVASAWLISREVAPAWRSIETEKAWAAARAYAEIEINKLRVASGQKPELSEWSRLKAAGARVQLSDYTLFGVGALAGAAGVVGAYYGLRSKQEPRRALPPKRENPAPRRRARPQAQTSNPARKSRPAKRKSSTARGKAPKRKNPSRRKKVRTVDPRPIVNGKPWGHLHPPAKYAKQGATKRSDYAAPSAYMYPIRTAGHVRAARARFAKYGGRYPSGLRLTISRNIAKAERRHGMSTNKPAPRRRPSSPKRTRRPSTSTKKRTPGRDAKGRFVSRKPKRSPKGRTRRASRRGGKGKGAGQRSPAK